MPFVGASGLLARLLISFYQSFLSAFFGGACRFEPSCSEYASQAFLKHPPLKALRMSLARIVRCRPGGSYGFDPVPECECQNGR